MNIQLRFFLDSGLVRHFIPLSSDAVTDGLIGSQNPRVPNSLISQYAQLQEFIQEQCLTNDVSTEVYNYCVRQTPFTGGRKDSKDVPYGQYCKDRFVQCRTFRPS